MFSESEVKNIASKIAAEYAGEMTIHPAHISTKLSRGEKEIYIEWPKHDLAEVWMTFIQGSEEIYQDWLECMEPEYKTEFARYIQSIPDKYFTHETRVKRHELILRRYVLEAKQTTGWGDIFE